MLKRITKEQLLPEVQLTVTSLGEPISFGITYIARPQQEIDALLADPGVDMSKMIVLIVKSWETEYDLTQEGVRELEGERPGMIAAIIQGWYRARAAELEKN